MKSKSPVLLVLLALLLAGGIGYLLLSDPNSETFAVTKVDQAEERTKDRSTSELSTPEVVSKARDEAPVVERAETPRPKPVSHAGSIWVEGRVVFPSNTPTDEVVTVIARGKKFKGKEEDANLYKTEAAQNGRFRVAFAKGTRRGKLTINAKYLYLEKSVKLAGGGWEKEPVLEPKLGGCIDISLIPASAAPLSDEELEGVQISGYSNSEAGMFMQLKGQQVEGPLFRIGGLEAGLEYRVGFGSSHFLTLNSDGVEVSPGKVTEVEFTVELGASVAGRVVDKNGDPVAEVEVTFETENSWESAQTDEQGKFEKGGLATGDLTIRLRKKGFERAEHGPFAIVQGESTAGLELLIGNGNSVTGIVTWPDGKPAAKATVVLEQTREGDDWGYYVGSAETKETTGDDGTFAITGLGDEECTISVRAQPALEPIEGETDGQRKRRKKAQPYWHAKLEAVSPGTGLLTFVLHEGAGVRGVVVDDQGNPLKRFKVIASVRTDTPWNTSGSARVSQTVKDSEDGSFLLEGLKEGEFEIYATARGHASVSRQELDIPWNGSSVKIVLPRQASISGVVHDLAGKPIAGARVEQEYVSESSSSFFSRGDHSDTTDEDGIFHIKSVAPGPSRIKADAPGMAGSGWTLLDIAPAQDLTDVTLNMRLGATLTGVLHPGVGVIDGVTVNLWGSDGNGSHDTETESNGEFRFDSLGPGEYQIQFEPDMSDVDRDDDTFWTIKQSRSEQMELQLKEGETKHIVLGAPSEKPIVVSGVVTSGGEPVEGRLVTAQKLGENRGRNSEAIQTDAAGGYALTLDGPGSYQFTIGEGWGSNTILTKEIPDQERFKLDFELPTSVLSGVVRGPGAELLNGTTVTLERRADADDKQVETNSPWESFRREETDEDGEFRFEHLSPGRYMLRAGGPDLWGRNRGTVYGREMIADIQVVEGKELAVLELNLRPAGTIKGVVLDSAGSFVAGASVSIENKDGLKFEIWERNRTDQGGQFSVRGLSAGTYTVIASGGDKGRMEARVEVFEGGTSELELVLR